VEKMNKVTSTTIKISPQSLKRGVVVMAAEEYERLQTRAIPTYYLTGKKALELDRLVEEGLCEHRVGKTIKARSLKEALKVYERRHGRN